MPEGIIVASFGLRVKESSQQAIKSNPADPFVWYLGASYSLPILESRILYFSFMLRRLIIA